MKNDYLAIGLMSGTSLDGLDIALCRFNKNDTWDFIIEDAVTVPYSDDWKQNLSRAHAMSGLELSQLHVDLGILHGNLTNSFIRNRRIHPDFIASHGHTIFHQPEKRLTLQIGSPAHIAAHTGHTVVADFRTTDVANYGQGAPLVPIGDLLLFPEFEYCLNLGGIANISYKQKGAPILAYDICPCNMALNFLAEKNGRAYDDGGSMAASGNVLEALLSELNSLAFYAQPSPKSLGKEFFDASILPLISGDFAVNDLLRTFTEHIAIQITRTLDNDGGKKMLVTGGGAFNSFLIERMKAMTSVDIVVPDKNTVQFKEALIFAFLGVLRVREEVNCLSSVTGASKDSVGGAIYLG